MTAANGSGKKGKEKEEAEPAKPRDPAAASAAAAAYAQAQETVGAQALTSPPVEAPAAPPAPEPPTPEAGERIAELEAELATMRDQFLRALAETDNTRKRAERDREDAGKYAIANFARDMLTAADNLQRALDAVPADARAGNTALAALLDGVQLTERQLLALLEKHGVARVSPLGEAFDPNLHQAMLEMPGAGKPAGTVIQVLQAGYVIHGRLLRPALVGIAKGEPEKTED